MLSKRALSSSAAFFGRTTANRHAAEKMSPVADRMSRYRDDFTIFQFFLVA
jgi:hypothetical protein